MSLNELIGKKKESRLKWLVFIVAFLVYSNTLTHQYAWDDSIVITENPRVKKGISGIPELFLKYNSDYKADKYGYRPIVLSTFAIEYGLFKDNSSVGHFMNVLYYALLCVVIFKVLGSFFSGRASTTVIAIISLFFAVHPVHTEAVANIKSRDEILALLFGLLSLNHFLLFSRNGLLKHLLYFALLFLAALLCKESAVSLLLVAPLITFFFGNVKELKKLLIPVLSIVLMAAASFLIYKLYSSSKLGVESSQGAGIFYESGLLGNSFFYTDLLLMKIANALSVLLLYLKNFLLPVRQLYFYGYNQVPVASWSQPGVIASLFIHLVMLTLAIVYSRKRNPISFGILFYFATIFFYLHIIRTLADTMADRFLFTPSLGLCIALVFAITALFKINISPGASALDFKNYPAVPRYILLIAISALGLKTLARNRAWKDNWTLTSTDMPYLENCARAHNYYAQELKLKLNAGFDAAIEADMIKHYEKAITISKESYYSYLGLGIYYNDKKRFTESVKLFTDVIGRFPDLADPQYFIGEAYYNLGETGKAIQHLETSLRIAPNVQSSYYMLATAYSKDGRHDKALDLITVAKSKFGFSVKTSETMSHIYFEKGELDKSASSALEMIPLGADPQLVYKIIIGRYQFAKNDSMAAVYFRQGQQKGYFAR